MFLGPFNGVTDGSGGIIGIFIFMGIVGNDFWVNQAFGTWRINDIVIASLLVGQIIIIGLCFKSVFDHQKKTLSAEDITGEPLVIKYLFIQTFGYCLPLALLTWLAYVGTSPLLPAPKNGAQSNALFFLILLQCFLMQHLTCNIQVHHVCKSHYNPFNSKLNLFILVGTIVSIVLASSSKGPVVNNCIFLMLVITVISQWHFILNVINEMATALGIRILKVKDNVSFDPHTINLQ